MDEIEKTAKKVAKKACCILSIIEVIFATVFTSLIITSFIETLKTYEIVMSFISAIIFLSMKVSKLLIIFLN